MRAAALQLLRCLINFQSVVILLLRDSLTIILFRAVAGRNEGTRMARSAFFPWPLEFRSRSFSISFLFCSFIFNIPVNRPFTRVRACRAKRTEDKTLKRVLNFALRPRWFLYFCTKKSRQEDITIRIILAESRARKVLVKCRARGLRLNFRE